MTLAFVAVSLNVITLLLQKCHRHWRCSRCSSTKRTCLRCVKSSANLEPRKESIWWCVGQVVPDTDD